MAIPPTTPPTIAPMGVLLPPEVDALEALSVADGTIAELAVVIDDVVADEVIVLLAKAASVTGDLEKLVVDETVEVVGDCCGVLEAVVENVVDADVDGGLA